METEILGVEKPHAQSPIPFPLWWPWAVGRESHGSKEHSLKISRSDGFYVPISL